MKRVAPLIVLGALTVATPASLGTRGDSSSAPRAAEAAPAEPALAPAPAPASGLVREAKQGQLFVYVPQDCFAEREVDLVVHFHGAPPVMGHALGEARLNAALAVENLGTISQDYGSAYTVVARLDDLVRRAMGLVARACPGQEYHPRRLALSAWSAGYAAVGAILSHPELAARVDAVLLSDGLHGAFLESGWRQLPLNALAPFVDFARRAVSGTRLMAITHTAIHTDGYASTTETTSFLLDRLGLERVVFVPAESRFGMDLESEAIRGNFTVEGYAGGDEAAHARQLHSMGRTLFAPLRRRWEATAAAVPSQPAPASSAAGPAPATPTSP
ncbi:MAG TPA: hypothetical protein PLU22_27405 [Polyangiaceae bacterium]|nr:hypothetical protein [Polyangiaceae bacterium]